MYYIENILENIETIIEAYYIGIIKKNDGWQWISQ